MARKSFCKREYRSASNWALEDKADSIKNGIYSNATTFAAPPTTQAQLATLMSSYATARAAHDQGGTAQMPAFTAARKALIAGLDVLATYVDGIANGNAQIVKQAGFAATFDAVSSTARTTNTAPATPQNVTFKRVENNSGQMVAECENYGTGFKYISLLTENSPLPAGVAVDDSGNVTIPANCAVAVAINIDTKRRKLFKGLNPGSTYYVYYVVVNTKGASGISTAKSMLCG